jgi:type IV pilus assembly protein PilF
MSQDPKHVHHLIVALACAMLAFGCATDASRAQAHADMQRARSHYDIGADHIRSGQYEMALREYLAAVSLQPLNPDYQLATGLAYVRKQRFREAEAHMRRALEIAPTFHDARFNLSTLMIGVGRYEDARVEAQRLYDDPTYPAPWRALSNRGWAEYKLGRVADARETFALARKFNPTYWPALLNLGILESEQGRRPEAIQLFEALVSQRPPPNAELAAEANFRLGEIYVSLGKPNRAAEYLTAAVMKAPSGPWGRKSEQALKQLR